MTAGTAEVITDILMYRHEDDTRMIPKFSIKFKTRLYQ